MKPLNWLILTLCMAISTPTILSAQQNITPESMEGFWEGDFMAGQNLTLIFHFHMEDDHALSGDVLLYQGDVQVQYDPLSEIVLNRNKLSFTLAATSTTFEGKVDPKKRKLTGHFIFPDGGTPPVSVKQTSTPSVANLSEAQMVRAQGNVFEREYSPEQLSADVEFIRLQLEAYHPQLHLYTPHDGFENHIEEILSGLDDPMTEADFIRTLAPLFADIRCVHTGIRPSAEMDRALDRKPMYIPLHVHISNERLYIVESYQTELNIPPGSLINRINGRSSSEIMEQLVDVIPADGFNLTSKYHEINKNFPLLYGMYIEYNSQFELDVTLPDGSVSTYDLDAISRYRHTDLILEKYPEELNPGNFPYDLKIDGHNSIAYLDIDGFWSPTLSHYCVFLQDVFCTLSDQSVENLVIDLRGNSGGHPYFASELLTYLIDEPAVYFAKPANPRDLNDLFEQLEPNLNTYNGKVYILMDGGSLSTSGHFLALVKDKHLATLIGETAGGSFYCNDGGVYFHLPNTKINMHIPRTTFEVAVDHWSYGKQIEPDHEVSTTVEDLIDGKDAVMEYTRELIKTAVN